MSERSERIISTAPLPSEARPLTAGPPKEGRR